MTRAVPRALAAALTITAVLAVPVAPKQAVAPLSEEADQLVVVATPEPFYAVGQWYASFEQVSDEEVVRILSSGERRTNSTPTSA